MDIQTNTRSGVGLKDSSALLAELDHVVVRDSGKEVPHLDNIALPKNFRTLFGEPPQPPSRRQTTLGSNDDALHRASVDELDEAVVKVVRGHPQSRDDRGANPGLVSDIGREGALDGTGCEGNALWKRSEGSGKALEDFDGVGGGRVRGVTNDDGQNCEVAAVDK